MTVIETAVRRGMKRPAGYLTYQSRTREPAQLIGFVITTDLADWVTDVVGRAAQTTSPTLLAICSTLQLAAWLQPEPESLIGHRPAVPALQPIAIADARQQYHVMMQMHRYRVCTLEAQNLAHVVAEAHRFEVPLEVVVIAILSCHRQLALARDQYRAPSDGDTSRT